MIRYIGTDLTTHWDPVKSEVMYPWNVQPALTDTDPISFLEELYQDTRRRWHWPVFEDGEVPPPEPGLLTGSNVPGPSLTTCNCLLIQSLLSLTWPASSYRTAHRVPTSGHWGRAEEQGGAVVPWTEAPVRQGILTGTPDISTISTSSTLSYTVHLLPDIQSRKIRGGVLSSLFSPRKTIHVYE